MATPDLGIIGIDHIGLGVSDYESAGDFYAQVLGFQEVESQEKEQGVRWFKSPDGILIHLIRPRKAGNRPDHTALKVSDFAHALAVIEQTGLQIILGPGARDNGQQYVFILDSEGNKIELTADLD
jgi:catechol 2,3-dioxygenase-like lactoylglutathione lyase family enzyme